MRHWSAKEKGNVYADAANVTSHRATANTMASSVNATMNIAKKATMYSVQVMGDADVVNVSVMKAMKERHATVRNLMKFVRKMAPCVTDVVNVYVMSVNVRDHTGSHSAKNVLLVNVHVNNQGVVLNVWPLEPVHWKRIAQHPVLILQSKRLINCLRAIVVLKIKKDAGCHLQ